MNVFIVVVEYCIEYENHIRIEGVFSTEELALDFINQIETDENTIEIYITSFELDKVY